MPTRLSLIRSDKAINASVLSMYQRFTISMGEIEIWEIAIIL